MTFRTFEGLSRFEGEGPANDRVLAAIVELPAHPAGHPDRWTPALAYGRLIAGRMPARADETDDELLTRKAAGQPARRPCYRHLRYTADEMFDAVVMPGCPPPFKTSELNWPSDCGSCGVG